MKKLSIASIKIVALCCLVFSIAACQSTPKKSSAAAANLKEADYEKLVQEWQTLKPGISRLLAIETELNALLGELENLQAGLEKEQSTAQLAQQSAPVQALHYQPTVATPAPVVAQQVAEVAAPVSVAQPEVTSATGRTGNYALQVASITEPHKLPQTWQSLMNRNPQLLRDLEPNFQKIQVKNTDYYRLKVGSFSSLQEANRKCDSLKSAGISCLVADYSSSNFSQLDPQMLVTR